MKKVALLTSSILLSLFSSQMIHAVACDETFYGTLRAGNAYNFYDDMTNRTGNPVFVNNTAWEFLPQYNYGAIPTFSESSLVASSHIWSPGETGRIINSSTYIIDTHPPVRSQNNLVINYEVTFSQQIGGVWGEGQTHRECKYYDISWCGDGVRDAGDGELCDLGAQNGQAGSTCSATCQPVTVTPPPVCPTTIPAVSSSPITFQSPGLCGAGESVAGFQTTGTNPIVYSWNCIGPGGSSPGCTTSYIPPVGPICGDGIRNGTESCDPTDPTHNGWGTANPGCNISCQPVNTSVIPRCEPSRTGTQTTPLTQGYCAPGSPRDFTATTVGTRINYTWTCYIPDDFSPSPTDNCTANYTPPVGPICGDGIRNGNPLEACDPNDPTRNGWGTLGCSAACEPLNNTSNPACNSISVSPSVGVSSLTSNVTCNTTDATTVSISCGNGQTINASNGVCTYSTIGTYTPRCTVNGTITNSACTTTVSVTPPNPTGFDLSIKKYIGTSDAQPGNPVTGLTTGGTFTYFLRVRNTGPNDSTGRTTVKDILPPGVEYSGAVNGNGFWTCSVAGRVLTCYTDSSISATAYVFAPDIAVPVRITATTGSVTNIASVDNPNEINRCNADGSLPGSDTASCTKDTTNSDPAVFILGSVNTGTGFDLALKKYINTDDAQTAPGGDRNTNTTFSYGIVVTNKGPQSSTGITTVQDILPAGVVYDSTSTGWTNGGWTCTYSGTIVTVKCTTSDIVARGGNYTTILIPVKILAGANATVLNIAAVDNPYETGRCNADGSLPSNGTTYCTLDNTNSDPAYFHVPGGTTGGPSYIGRKCINGIPECPGYTTEDACKRDGTSNCYPADPAGMARCRAEALSCGGPGGPPGCTGPTCYTSGRCGDGVLGSSAGEECDLGNANSDAVGSLCSTSCKLHIFTTPGANPITDIWMTIPTLSNMRLGYSWLDGEVGKIRFEENRMVIGANTSAFTLADTVGFGIKTQYKIPLAVEADKDICLSSTAGGLSGQRICTKFGYNSNGLDSFVNLATGKRYVLLGQGSYQVYNPSTKTYSGYTTSTGNPNSITLFKGPDTYGNTTLRNAFIGRTIGQVSQISLINVTESGYDIPLVSLDVRVSGAMVGGTSSTVNRTRSLETYLKPSNDLAAFLAQFSSRVKGTSTTTTATTNSTSSTTTANINISSTLAPSNGLSISSVDGLSSYKLNGNSNIFSVKGNVTIENCGTSGFVLSGVRTLIVDGNLTIKCNIGYVSNDTTSSWAFITKNGDIRVYNGQNTPNVGAVTNIAGVYVAIPGTSGGGNFTYDGAATTTAILRLNGSMYGNATPLFQSRLYVRGTNAYDILTTGVILSYSNRALVNPPPLLSSYLNNYSVSRVVR